MAATLALSLTGGGSDAQSSGPAGACRAEVTVDDSNVQQCPLASLHFHVLVSDCQDSKGAFEYRYLRVDPERKETLQRTASWIAHGKQLDVVERVPASCDEEIDGAEVLGVTSCTCVQR